MASILKSADIVNAKSSVTNYVTTAQQLYSELQSTINNLTAILCIFIIQEEFF